MAIAELPRESFENKSIAVLVAVNLIKLGYAEAANKVLAQLEPALAKDPHYWTLLSKTAYDLHDANLLRYAIEKSYELQPEDPATLNNYAALLLSFREKPEVAIQLTLRLMGLFPGSVSLRINHICALLQNKRIAEAERLLADISAENLKPMDVSSYSRAVFEAALEQHDPAAALKASKHIDRTFLIGPDRAWFETALNKMATLN
jgi:Flp pilus assembly protein TadD